MKMNCSIRSTRHYRHWIAATISLLCGVTCGCGDGRPDLAAVSGRVTIDGQPLTKGSISFIPAKGRQAGGAIESDGRYVLTCFEKGDGAILGDYKVAVNGVEYLSETLLKWHAPKKYSNPATSGLTAAIDGPRDDLNFELSWDGGKPFEEKTR